MLMVNGPAIITSAFPACERGTALGILAMVVSGGLISGPSIGGFLISHLGWRSIFLVNIPIGLAGIYLVFRYVIDDSFFSKEKAPFDWVGALLQMVVLISFILIFDPPQISVSGSVPFMVSRLVIAAITVVFAAVFLKVESEAEAPVFDFSLLKNRTFSAANLASFMTFVAFSSVSVLMPFFLEEMMGFQPHQAGLFMTAIPLTIFVVAPISGRLSDRFGGQELSVAGTFIGAIGLLMMSGVVGSGLTKNVGNAGIVFSLCTIGLAMGLFQSPNNNAIMGAVPADKLGVASALLATIRNLGLITGTGLSTALFSWKMEASGDFILSLHTAHLVGGIIAVLAMLASLSRGHTPPATGKA
jgi:MFS family permease